MLNTAEAHRLTVAEAGSLKSVSAGSRCLGDLRRNPRTPVSGSLSTPEPGAASLQSPLCVTLLPAGCVFPSVSCKYICVRFRAHPDNPLHLELFNYIFKDPFLALGNISRLQGFRRGQIFWEPTPFPPTHTLFTRLQKPVSSEEISLRGCTALSL